MSEQSLLETPDIRRRLGTKDLIFFVIAAATPLGFALGAIPLIIGRGGLAAPAGFIMIAVILAIFGVGYVLMAKHMQRAGGLYAFVAAGLGQRAGAGASVVALVVYASAATGAIGVFSIFAQSMFNMLVGIDIAWWVYALASVLAFGVMGTRRIDFNAAVMGVIVAIEVLLLVGLSIAIIVQGGASGLDFEPFTPTAISQSHLGPMLAVSIAAFAGFEATVIYSGEAKNGHRTVRRATFGVLVLLGLLYTLVTWAVIMAFGVENVLEAAIVDPIGLFFVAAEKFVGPWASVLFSVLVVLSWFASILAFHNATARYLASMGESGLVPRVFARIDRATGAPRVASLTHSGFSLLVVLVFAIFGLDPYLQLYIIASTPAVIGIPVLEFLASIAIAVYFLKRKSIDAPWAQVVAPLAAAALLGILLFTLVAQLEVFTESGPLVNSLLVLSIVAAFVVGVVRGTVLIRRDIDFKI